MYHTTNFVTYKFGKMTTAKRKIRERRGGTPSKNVTKQLVLWVLTAKGWWYHLETHNSALSIIVSGTNCMTPPAKTLNPIHQRNTAAENILLQGSINVIPNIQLQQKSTSKNSMSRNRRRDLCTLTFPFT